MTRPLHAAAAMVLALSACSTTRLADTWRDPGYVSRPVERILVIGVLVRDEQLDASFENALARNLTNDGFKVVTASMAFSPGEMDGDRIEKFTRDHRIDLVVQMRIAQLVSSSYTPPSTAYQALPTNVAGGWYGGWTSPAMVVTQPGHVSEGSSVEAEIKVFSVGSQALVWSASSSTSNVVGDRDAGRSLAHEVARDLRKAGILVR